MDDEKSLEDFIKEEFEFGGSLYFCSEFMSICNEEGKGNPLDFSIYSDETNEVLKVFNIREYIMEQFQYGYDIPEIEVRGKKLISELRSIADEIETFLRKDD